MTYNVFGGALNLVQLNCSELKEKINKIRKVNMDNYNLVRLGVGVGEEEPTKIILSQ